MEFINTMIQWLQDLLVLLLDESVFLNESLKWMIQKVNTILTATFTT